MRRVTIIAALFSLICAGTLVHAQPYPGKGFPSKGRPMGPVKQTEMERVREFPGERVREFPGAGRPFHERLSPEERRQLRRDIDQHGREVYRGRNR